MLNRVLNKPLPINHQLMFCFHDHFQLSGVELLVKYHQDLSFNMTMFSLRCLPLLTSEIKTKMHLWGGWLHEFRSGEINFFNSVSNQPLITIYMKYPEKNSLRVSFHCRHFDRNKNSFRVIKCNVNNTQNEIIRNEMSTHANIKETY